MRTHGTFASLVSPNRQDSEHLQVESSPRISTAAKPAEKGVVMPQILIAAFDRYAEAEQVKTEILSKGITGDAIQISASCNPDNNDSSRVEVVGEEPGDDASVAEKIGSFFGKVFGDD